MPILKPSEINIEKLASQYTDGKPYIICCDNKRLFRKLNEFGFKEIDLNLELAKRLILYEKNKRNSVLDKEIRNVLDSSGSQLLIKGIDILFNPEYQIDVVKELCELARHFSIFVIWPGKMQNDALYYAEPGYEDYRKYDINKYNIICIK